MKICRPTSLLMLAIIVVKKTKMAAPDVKVSVA
jgi:hypothetical protein